MINKSHKPGDYIKGKTCECTDTAIAICACGICQKCHGYRTWQSKIYSTTVKT